MKGLTHEHDFAISNLLAINHKELMLMNPSTDIDNLRQRAILAKAKRQKALIDKSSSDIGKMTTDEVQALVYELQVHQIELVMQNEELIDTQQNLRKSQQDYARIYDLAPIAYLTVSQQGLIQQANIAAVTLFNLSRESLLNQRLEKLIHADDQDAYYLFLRKLLKEQSSPNLIIRLPIPNHAIHQPHCHNYDASQCSIYHCPENTAVVYLELKATVDRHENNELIIYLALKDVTSHKFLEETLDLSLIHI
jgi:PAS domain-containing protein